jgi:hypothetical protein
MSEKVDHLAKKSPLSKTSSNLEIPQSNRKNLPTENESSSITQNRDGPQLELAREKNADTEATKINDSGEQSVSIFPF